MYVHNVCTYHIPLARDKMLSKTLFRLVLGGETSRTHAGSSVGFGGRHRQRKSGIFGGWIQLDDGCGGSSFDFLLDHHDEGSFLIVDGVNVVLEERIVDGFFFVFVFFGGLLFVRDLRKVFSVCVGRRRHEGVADLEQFLVGAGAGKRWMGRHGGRKRFLATGKRLKNAAGATRQCDLPFFPITVTTTLLGTLASSKVFIVHFNETFPVEIHHRRSRARRLHRTVNHIHCRSCSSALLLHLGAGLHNRRHGDLT
jgi:hypothetical protein